MVLKTRRLNVSITGGSGVGQRCCSRWRNLPWVIYYHLMSCQLACRTLYKSMLRSVLHVTGPVFIARSHAGVVLTVDILFVRLVLCDKNDSNFWYCERRIPLAFWLQQCSVWEHPFPLKIGPKLPTIQKRQLRHLASSALALRASKKVSLY